MAGEWRVALGPNRRGRGRGAPYFEPGRLEELGEGDGGPACERGSWTVLRGHRPSFATWGELGSSRTPRGLRWTRAFG
jgi:hypothetical protein